MKKWKALGGTAGLVIALSGPAQAEVTGMQVWENWLAAGKSMGQKIDPGSIDQSGDTLTIRDVAIAVEAPEVSVTGTVDLVEFTDRDDGTVAVTFSPTYDMTVAFAPETGESGTVTLSVAQEGMTMVASESDGGGIAYDFVAPSIEVTASELVVDGETMDMSVLAALSGVAGHYDVGAGDMPAVSSRVTAETLSFDLDATEPGGSDTIAFDLAMADLEAVSDGTMGMMADLENIAEMLAKGMTTSGALSHGPASYSLVASGSENFSFEATADAGALDVSMDAEALGYSFSNTGYAVVVSGDDIPMPEITAEAEEIGFSILMPVSASDVPQDFGFGVTLAGFSVSEMIWGMVDPGGALSHDPATLIVDLAGTANWFIDIMDPEAQARMGSEVPGALHSLDIRELLLSLAGAELTGTGGFTFDNDDLATFDGLPAPDGKVDLRLVGANTLIDNLVAMGLVPEDQAMGARMMMGLFARPGDGPDTLVSTIEVRPDGAILANGQRLQ